MTRFQKWVLGTSGILAIGIVGFVVANRAAPLDKDLEFLVEMGGNPKSLPAMIGMGHGTSFKIVSGTDGLQFDIAEPIAKVNDRVKKELGTRGWQREWISTGKNVVFTKTLTGNSERIWVETNSAGGTWTSVLIYDERRKVPGWRIWLYNLLH